MPFFAPAWLTSANISFQASDLRAFNVRPLPRASWSVHRFVGSVHRDIVPLLVSSAVAPSVSNRMEWLLLALALRFIRRHRPIARRIPLGMVSPCTRIDVKLRGSHGIVFLKIIGTIRRSKSGETSLRLPVRQTRVWLRIRHGDEQQTREQECKSNVPVYQPGDTRLTAFVCSGV